MRFVNNNGETCDSVFKAFINTILAGKSSVTIEGPERESPHAPVVNVGSKSPKIVIIQNGAPNQIIDGEYVSKVVINQDLNVVSILDHDYTYDDVYTCKRETIVDIDPASVKISDSLLDKLKDFDDSILEKM